MVSNLGRFFYHPQRFPLLRHILNSFDFAESVTAHQETNIHILDIYRQSLMKCTVIVPSIVKSMLYQRKEFFKYVNVCNCVVMLFFSEFESRLSRK